MNLYKLTTEQRNPDTMNLDAMTSREIAAVMNHEDAKVPQAISQVLDDIAIAIDWAAEALFNGGRIIYFGCGTSGRLGVLDAVECPPTFGVSSDVVVGLIAGGSGAFVKAKEGAEDSFTEAEIDLKDIHLTSKDLLIGLAASGRTPYVIGGFKYADTLGCKTIAISCNKDSDIGRNAHLKIEAVVGPEVLTGSTRLKAGTAQKLILNMISTGAMTHFGKVYQNLMVDVKQSNEKLVVRARNIVKEATGTDDEIATKTIKEADGSVKVAITMILHDCDKDQAIAMLEKTRGKVRDTLHL